MNALAEDIRACRYIIDLIYEHCRIKLNEGKEALIKARLGKLMRRQRITSLANYVEFLRSRPDAEEFTRVVDALTTNFTNFMREPDHFEFLVHRALPQVLASDQRTFCIWSAASSSGEEPYTIAMFLAEHYPVERGWDWRVIASDISTKVLALAKRAIYPAERVKAVPRGWLRKHFQQGTGEWDGHVRVKPNLAQRVSFQQLNLIEPYDHSLPFEVIFCRNVMIYFDRPTQEQLVASLCRFLVPGGFLLIGHSESLNGLDVPLHCVKPSIYQRL